MRAMKKTTIQFAWLAAVAASLLSACVKESPVTPPSSSGSLALQFVAGVPDCYTDGARAGYDNATGHVHWTPGDRLGVFVAGDATNQNREFTQVEGSLSPDCRTAQYEGTLHPVSDEQTVYACYPYDPGATLAQNVLTTQFPGIQTYTPSGYTGIPLFAKYTGDVATLAFDSFMNPFAVIELRLKAEETGIRVKRIVFRGNNGESVSGTIGVDMGGERPSVSFPAPAADGTSTQIVLDCGEGVELTAAEKSFYIAVPVQEYTAGYRFDIRTDREGANTVVLKARSEGVTPAANTIYSTPVRTLASTDYKYIVPDKAFRDYLVESGYAAIDDEQIGAVTITAPNLRAMDCERRSIESLAGLEYFPQLFNVMCNDNRLTVLDLSGNAALQVIQCYRNQLTYLNITQNAVLQTLDCSGNRLSSLDVSRNMALKALNCYANRLTTLDVSRNLALRALVCWGNRLTVLDASAMVDPESYILRCGRQTDDGGGVRPLTLTLREEQMDRWINTLAGDGQYNSSVVLKQ